MADYAKTYDHLLIDSGAYSVFSSGVRIDALEYKEWHEQWDGMADAVAGLDDIDGDWRKSLRNYEVGGGFPTYHDTDPPELLSQLVGLAAERGKWLGIGLKPPRNNRRGWLRETLDQIPGDIHVHGWAMRKYGDLARFDSVDSTNWWRDGFKLKTQLPWLSYGECLDVIVKRYQRCHRNTPVDRDDEPKLF